MKGKIDDDLIELIGQGQILNGLEAPGNNLQNLTNNNLTINKCIEECTKNIRCVGISFRYADRMCFLKYAIGQLVSAIGIDVVYVRDPRKFVR